MQVASGGDCEGRCSKGNAGQQEQLFIINLPNINRSSHVHVGAEAASQVSCVCAVSLFLHVVCRTVCLGMSPSC